MRSSLTELNICDSLWRDAIHCDCRLCSSCAIGT